MTEALAKEKFDTNTKVQDKNGNTLTVPSGFKIVPNGQDEVVYKDKDNPTVQDGIVIEDVTAGGKGNQFVWVPVGEIKNGEGVANTSIALERRTFNEAVDGKCTVAEHTADGATHIEYNQIEQTPEEHSKKNYGNAIAKDIEEFKTGVATNGGYYLARFEASGSGEDPAKSVKGVDPWVNITQANASARSQAMYNDDESKGYQSDLVNSYAWDTAIYYIQECSEDKDYARQSGSSKTYQIDKTGENILLSPEERDQRCNICDMAGNVFEWSTEMTIMNYATCCLRGGVSGEISDYFPSRRVCAEPEHFDSDKGFRPLLYVK